MDSTGPFDPRLIKSLWIQPACVAIAASDIHSTRDWSANELGFFRVRIFPVSPNEWKTYIVPESTLLTSKAKKLAECTMSAGAFSNNMHLAEGVPKVVQQFGDVINIVYNQHSSEPGVDRLAAFILQVCNPNIRELVDVPQMKQLSVSVGASIFKSIPDASVVSRFVDWNDQPAIFIVVEDKTKSSADSGEFQVIGEMIAVACFNYFNIAKIPQTVCALRIKGDAISFYRADFSVDYLVSIQKGTPASNLVVFRLFGGNTVMLLSEGSQRSEILKVLSSIFHTSLQLATKLKRGSTEASTVTTDRLANLAGV